MSEWSKETVPREIAHEVFGLTLRADLVASSPVPDNSGILSAVEPDPTRLCSTDDIRHQTGAAEAALPSGTKFHYRVSSYTFPVFNAKFDKSIVIWTSLYASKRLGEADTRSGSVDFTISALIYIKHRKTWRLVKTEVIGQT